jgi:uncharacterized heparinase superfamily protein
LWRFHLHYHEYLLDLAAEGIGCDDDAWFELAWEIVRQWIAGNSLDDPRSLIDAWHPYCISRRLPVWSLLWTAWPPSDALVRQVSGSMTAQARFLENHLERDLGGNHLLENARTLIVVGAFFDGSDAERWLRIGEEILHKGIMEQILPHGEHFERSPMYHVHVLELLLDVRDVVAGIRPHLAHLCGETARRAAGFLREIVHPDGRIPLFADSCYSELPSTTHIFDRVSNAEQVLLSQTLSTALPAKPSDKVAVTSVGDYWVFRNGGDSLLFDAGPVGPDHLPAHAHADLLTFEASVGGRQLFVDSGVFGYEDDAMRRYCRGTAAHNVLQVDDTDQCDIWSRFRMGYRGWPDHREHGEEHGFFWARASHNAYRRLGVAEVGRWIACRPTGPWFCVDWALGKGRHRFTTRLHLHPDVSTEQITPDEIRLDLFGTNLFLRFLAPGQVDSRLGWYCPEFGRRIPHSIIEWTAVRTLPVVCGWELTWSAHTEDAALSNASGRVVLSWPEGIQTFQFCPRRGRFNGRRMPGPP